MAWYTAVQAHGACALATGKLVKEPNCGSCCIDRNSGDGRLCRWYPVLQSLQTGMHIHRKGRSCLEGCSQLRRAISRRKSMLPLQKNVDTQCLRKVWTFCCSICARQRCVPAAHG